MTPVGQALPSAHRVDICESTESEVERSFFLQGFGAWNHFTGYLQPPGRWLDTSIINLLIYRGD